jgi:hypothetical protein
MFVNRQRLLASTSGGACFPFLFITKAGRRGSEASISF